MPSVLGNTTLDTRIALESDLEQQVVAVGAPFDAECEYVASPADGGCRISPPYYFYISGSCDCTIELYIPAGSNSSDCFSIGAWKSSNCCCLFANSGTATQFRYGSTNVVNGTYATDTWQTLGFVGTTVYCGSSTGSFTRSSFSDTTADFGVGFGKNIRIRRIRLTYRNTNIFDARPVRVGQIGAMYDVVSGGIFYSPNTNNLVPGPDVSTPTFTPKTEIDLLAPLASPAFTGTPTAPTAASGTNTTQVATTAFVQSAVGGLDLSIVSGKLCVSFEE